MEVIGYWLPFSAMTFFLPRVMPLGHKMLSITKATRPAPFKPLFSILASSPQSVQYIKLKRTQKNIMLHFILNLKINFSNFCTSLSQICNLSDKFTYLFTASTAMALGLSRFSEIRVFLLPPSVVATEIVFNMLSVQ